MTSRGANYTSEQRQAIESRRVSVSLSAGAGCGKTFVLTERFLSYFEPGHPDALQPDDLGQLVAITFTERAAREMRERVRANCYQRLAESGPSESAYWTALLRSLDGARISTIHSFCGSLLRAHAVEVGIDPQFEVLEQSQADALLSNAIDDELRRLVAEQDPDTLSLAARFDLGGLRELLRALVMALGVEDPAPWLARTAAEQTRHWQEFHRQHVLPCLARELLAASPAREVLEVLRAHEPTNDRMRERRQTLLAAIDRISHRSFDVASLAGELESIRESAKVSHAGGAGAWPSDEVYQRFKSAAEELRDWIDGHETTLRFDAIAAQQAAEVGRALLTLAVSVEQRYARRKRELAVMDFDELLREAHRLLVDPAQKALRRELGSQIRLLLVDEFQDTDPLQVEVVKALVGDALEQGKLFFVGDYKQSIYRFRGADPHVFRRLREELPLPGRLSLTKNFRSQPAILEFVNALFWHELGEGYEPLRAARPHVQSGPAIEFLWAPAETPKEKVEETRKREARWIAKRICQILGSGQPLVGDGPDKSQLRSARPGDIAIQFRALSDVACYESALRETGIDYYLVGGHAFYAQQEIFDLVNLLRALESPADLVSLAGVLRSGFFSLTDETLFWLAGHVDGVLAGLRADKHPRELAPDEQRRARFAAQTLEYLRSRKNSLPTSALVTESLALTGYDAALANEFLGERKLANLRKLIEQARTFEQGGRFTLADFILELSESIARQPKEALAATHSEDMDAVRLMTIHQAKGLEFPIVIVADMERRINAGGAGAHLHRDLGPLVRLRDEPDAKAPPSGYHLWQMLEREEDEAELRRLLYVATTRAADHLILSSGVANLEKPSGPWLKLLASRFDLTSGQLRGPLPADEPQPEIIVTMTEPDVGKGATQGGTKLDLEALQSAIERAALDQPNRLPETAWVGKIPPDFAAPRQYSFSRLSGALARVDSDSAEYDVAPTTSADGRDLGILVHSVLAATDFTNSSDTTSKACRALVELHAERLLIDDGAIAAEALAIVEQFLASPRAHALATARHSLAEVEFLLAWPPGAPCTTTLRGYIDRIYQDSQDRWRVLDFKTNRVGPSGLPRIVDQYEMQMLVYALAVEQSLQVAPSELTLCLLRSGAEHSFDWNASARSKAIELVSQAMAASQAADVEAFTQATAYRGSGVNL